MPRQLSPLAAMRCATGKTQVELAYTLGVHPREVQRWELGRSVPEARRWPKYARALGISVTKLTKVILELNQLANAAPDDLSDNSIAE